MPGQHNFEHLPLIRRYQGSADLGRGPGQAPQTVANRKAHLAHSKSLLGQAQASTKNWKSARAERPSKTTPQLNVGIPLLVRVDPSLDLDVLREHFAFEIVAEQEDGYVIVASEDIMLSPFFNEVAAFGVMIHGSATVASVHELVDDPNQIERLRRILSEHLFESWAMLIDANVYVVDVGIACAGTKEIPKYPERGERDTDSTWAKKEREWADARDDAYISWDDLKSSREEEIKAFLRFYNGEALRFLDDLQSQCAILPDGFTTRIRINGKGLRDFVLNYPYIFEVVEPDDISLPQQFGQGATGGGPNEPPLPPSLDAPTVCVIDSGIQEGHLLLAPAIDKATSRCFLPAKQATDVADYVRPGGHGTRVAGAVLYGESVESAPTVFPFWIQNGRVLDENNKMPEDLFPPAAIRGAVEHFHYGPRNTRIFNHSINANSCCRLRYMSAWAAEIDAISANCDVLIIQSAGNIRPSADAPNLGIADHIAAGRTYPTFLNEPSGRIANPGQSLQALTVGSIAYGAFEAGEWRTFALHQGQPSAFTRSGLGVWDTIKPELVEYGGDGMQLDGSPGTVRIGGRIPEACPELVRSTLHPPGPAFDRDEAGTSFAAPKVARIAAQLQQLLPAEPAILYRALLVQSARWPAWAEALLTELHNLQPGKDKERRVQLLAEVSAAVRTLGYGVPNASRALSNTHHRVTFITNGEMRIKAGECDIFQVPIPSTISAVGNEFDIRIEVTLSYVAQPRRTRRNRRRYLSTWLGWKSSRLGEGLSDFRYRAMNDEEAAAAPQSGSALPWTIHENENWGLIRNTKRNSGTVQKDWAIVKSHALPEHFCIAVVGHQGWSRDPDSFARYALVVTFEIVRQEMAIYEPLRVAVEQLQHQIESMETESEV